ncbi:RNA-directed DNA polymerase, eukaryota, reverse transcriptase zinc-binding domain protein [Tanacetum coccineum]
MDLETSQITTIAKLSTLKQGPITTEEKVQKKNNMKVRKQQGKSHSPTHAPFLLEAPDTTDTLQCHTGNPKHYHWPMMRGINPKAQKMDWMIRLSKGANSLQAEETNKDALLSERWYCFNGVWAGLWSWRINPRGRSKSDLELLISYLQGVELRVGAEDRLVWSLDQQHSFSVKKLASLIDYNILRDHSLGSKSHTWNSLVPKKVNIHIWGLAKDRLPFLSKLLRLGINVDSVMCTLCGEVPKFINHIMVYYPKVKPIWLKCFSWWDLKPSHGDLSLYGLYEDDGIRFGMPLMRIRLWS